MCASSSPSAADAQKPPRNAGAENELPFGEALNALGELITVGLACLHATAQAPSPLTTEGEALSRQRDNVPGDRPPHRLIQAVKEWLHNVKAWISAHVEHVRYPHRLQEVMEKVDGLAEEVGLLAQAVSNLATEMHAGFGKVDAEFGKVDARFGKVDARFGEINESIGLLRAEIRTLKGMTYGPALERWTLSELPAFLRHYSALMLQVGPLKPQVLHHDRGPEWAMTRHFQEQWWDGEYPGTERENPLRADLVFSLRARNGLTLAFVCEISANADADDIERAALRCAWLSVHSRDKALCVIPVVVGADWRETAEAAARAAQVPCLQPVLRLQEDEEGERYPDGIDDWQPLADFDARLRHWMRAVLPADNER